MRRFDLTNIHTASPEAVKQVNQTVVLNLVRQLEPLSRSDLAEISGLHKSTITDIVRALLAEGLLYESGYRDSAGGRRAVQLRLNAARIRGIVVDVGVQQSSIVLGDVTGRLERRVAFATPADQASFLDRCLAELDRLFAVDPATLFRGITVSFPGLVDSSSNLLRLAPNLGWRDFDVSGALARYGLPVYVENEAKLGAMAELWFGETEDSEAEANYAFVSVTEGIGVGLVVDNQLYRGVRGSSGEFGHMTVQLDGPLCGCGKRGCWEALASETAVVKRAVESGFPVERGATGEGPAAFTQLLNAAGEGDPLARQALETMGRHLGLGIANIVNGLDLRLVIVGGRVTRAWELVEPALWEELRRQSLPTMTAELRIRPSRVEEPSVVVGGLVRSVSSVFQGMTLD